MAIAFDAHTASAATTWSHTCTGSNLVLYVGLFDSAGVTAVTYALAPMTKAASVGVGGGASTIDVWYLLGPATGTNSVVVAGGSPSSNHSASYTGVSQSGFPDASNTANPSGSASVGTSLTTVAANTWSFSFSRNTHGNTVTNTGNNITNQVSGADSVTFWDTGAPTVSASSTVNGNYITSDSGSANWALYIASFAPAGGAVATGRPNNLQLLGVS
jgi:hypothetical protein